MTLRRAPGRMQLHSHSSANSCTCVFTLKIHHRAVLPSVESHAPHQMGKGTETDHRLSLELFSRAAGLGDPEAHGQMGLRYAVGLAHPNNVQGAAIKRFDEVGGTGSGCVGCFWAVHVSFQPRLCGGAGVAWGS